MRYAAALRKLADEGGVITMMLQNSNETLTGVYSVNVTLHFYRGSLGRGYTAFPSVKGLYRDPADLIIPISRPNGYCCAEGFWFRVDNGSHIPAASVAVPRNAYRADLSKLQHELLKIVANNVNIFDIMAKYPY
ncbi:uncharacterized protein A4U43_C02F4020 [Asparagus officinalis]|uniref:Peptide N-acetyl-beta-D-glucosaminyl asparaginase amidase A N-terminal domain-containing protein n=1 Tax=Asparagus officinalis TaxID=4686 RepID=A0A5P1FKS3_ASPOF|nr:uncharacterized protein A4U43_C02F4020 [Asparagus officinalis]